MTTLTARPFLMFQGEAIEALALYVDAFFGSHTYDVQLYGAGEPGRIGTVKRVRLVIGDQEILVIDSPIKHAFTFTPSFSMFIDFDDEAQLRHAVNELGKGGQFLMPLDDYRFSRLFAWVQDRFGVPWQLNLK